MHLIVSAQVSIDHGSVSVTQWVRAFRTLRSQAAEPEHWVTDRAPRVAAAYLDLMAIFFSCFTASAVFGRLILRTPLSKFASILFSSTPSGRRNDRWNEP